MRWRRNSYDRQGSRPLYDYKHIFPSGNQGLLVNGQPVDPPKPPVSGTGLDTVTKLKALEFGHIQDAARQTNEH